MEKISVVGELRGVAARLLDAGKLLAAKPETSLIGDVARAHKDASQSALALVQQARALYLFDVLEAKPSEAAACIADLDKKAAVYVTCAKLFLSCCSACPRKLAAPVCRDVVRATAQLCTRVADRASNATHVGMLEKAVEAVGVLTWRAEVAAASLLLQSEGLLRDALGEYDEAVDEAAQAPSGGEEEEEKEEEGEVEEEEGGLLRYAPLASAVRELLSLAVELTAASRACLVDPSPGTAATDELEKAAGMLVTCAAALSVQADALVCAVAHEGDAGDTASHAGSFGKFLQKMLTVVSRRGGLGDAVAATGKDLDDLIARCLSAAHEAGSGTSAVVTSGPSAVDVMARLLEKSSLEG